MRLKDITPNLALTCLEPDAVVTVLTVNRISDDALQVFYQLPGSSEIRSQMLLREHEASIEIATEKRPWSFNGDGAEFILAVEAKRIDLAYLFDPMMAVHTSNVEPLPHQITAVYESMLTRQPLRLPLDGDLVVVLSGIAEIALGLALIFLFRQRVLAGLAAAAFFVLVFPGNVSPYVKGIDAFGLNTDQARFNRLFFQPLLVIWALWCTDAWRALWNALRSSTKLRIMR